MRSWGLRLVQDCPPIPTFLSSTVSVYLQDKCVNISNVITRKYSQHEKQPLLPGTFFPISISPDSDPGAFTIASAVPLDWEYQALGCFFHRYVVPADGIANPGWLDFLVELYIESSDFSCLRMAVRAVSIAHFANQSGSPWLSTRARKSYGVALQAVNLALKDPGQQTGVDTLTAVYLMIFFEARTHSMVRRDRCG